jgi:2-succinyl-5-enolpyruvyl-6-hydroxy-3-cyclohexene-1-carboxylate synthase
MVAESDHEGRSAPMNSTSLARATITQLVNKGITQFVLSPGSRNAPLSIALYEASERGLVELFVRIDERSAAYFALGLAKASQRYAVVICTSGTAVANYHPAVLEAYHAHERLLVISADRPARLRRTGANQTTLQSGLLAPLITIDTAAEVDLTERLDGGPVHLNLQFDEPLISNEKSDWLAGIHGGELAQHKSVPSEITASPRALIVVGHDRGGFESDAINAMIANSGLPVVAEDPLSVSHGLAHAALLLSDLRVRDYLAPEQIIVVGRTTLSRGINALIAQCPNLIVIDPRTQTVDTERQASQILLELPRIQVSVDQRWLTRWELARSLTMPELAWSEQSAVRAICRELPAESALFVSSSRPIRDIESFAAERTGVKTFANRGLAGIDGNISTAFGIAQHFKRNFAIVGDVTFLHDISALASPVDAELTIFVIDNNGGGIFNTLEQSSTPGFDRIFGTPHNLDLQALVTGFGIACEKVKSEADIKRAILHPGTGVRVVIVEVPDREENAKGLVEITQSLVSALLTGANLA